MIDNPYITHIALEYDAKALLGELNNAELVPYIPSRPTKGKTWFEDQVDWLTLTINDYSQFPEAERIKDLLTSIYGFEPVGKFFQLSPNVEIPPHTDMGHRACLNIVLSKDPAPIVYRGHGEELYTCAILNVAKRHGVAAGPVTRKMIKFQLDNIFYDEAVETWLASN